MANLSLYIPKETYIHQKVDPITKLIYFVCTLIVAFVVPTLIGALVVIAVQLFLLIWAREIHRAAILLAGVLILLLSIIIIQGLFHPSNETLVWQLGPLRFYEEGLVRGLTITLRMINIVAAASLLILTTSPSNLMEACMRRGMSPRIGYVITSIFQIIPMMFQSAARIQEAQESRGMNVKGSLWIRLKGFIPLIVPLIMSSLVNIKDRAMALEVRGFTSQAKKTFLNEEVVLPSMIVIRIGIVVITVGVVVWRIVI